MSSTLILPLSSSWTFSGGNYDLVNTVCTGDDTVRPFKSIALYENGTARHESIHATEVWMYYVDSSQGDAELILSVLDQTIRHTYLSMLQSSPYAGCVRKVLIADGLSPRIDMALDIRGRFRTGATGLSPSAHAFTFTNIEYLTTVEVDNPDVPPSSPTTTSTPTSFERPSANASAVSRVETPSASSTSRDHHSEAGRTGGPNHTPLILGCVMAGFVAMAAFLVVLVRARRRRNRRARCSQAGTSAPSDWTEYAMQARSVASPMDASRGSVFMAVPTQDPDVDERDAVLFDASIAAQSMALYDAMSSSDGARSPLISKGEKTEREQEQAAPRQSTPSSSHLEEAPAGVNRSTTRATAWDEPPPEYSL